MKKQVAFVPDLREAAFDTSKLNDETRTVEVVWSTGAAVDRRKFDWDTFRVVEFTEELDLSAGAVRMDRFNSGAAPVLDGHLSYSVRNDQVGVIQSASLENGKGRALLQISKRADCDGLWQDIRDGVVRNVSIGYRVYKYEIIKEDGKKDRYIARDWEPFETSFVPIPADGEAGVRSQEELATRQRPAGAMEVEIFNRAHVPNEETKMERTIDNASPGVAPGTDERAAPAAAPAPAAAAAPADAGWSARDLKKLTERAKLMGFTADDAIDATEATRSLEAATDWLQAKAAKTEQQRGMSPRIQITVDEVDTRRSLVENAIAHRARPGQVKLMDGAREWRGLRLLGMARQYLELEGVKVRGMTEMELAGAALGLRSAGMHSTSDFPLILANVADKRLREAYTAQSSSWKLFCRQNNAADFKSRYINQMSEAPSLTEIGENGEYSYGTLSEEGVSYALKTYGKIIAIGRKALINDDMGAFDRLPAMFGQAAARKEADLVWAQLTGNPTMGDGVTLFHASHGNLDGTGAAISIASLGAARAAMRKQKGLADEDYINVMAKFLLVPPELETVAEQAIAQIVANQASNVNTDWMRSLVPIVEPRLSDADTNGWYLAASPDQIDTIEYAYLEGQEGVYTETRIGFDVDGMELKVRHDFAAKAIDHRGFYKNIGA